MFEGLNEGDSAVLQKILTKNPDQLTEYEVNFLNARRDYLNNEQRRVFTSVLVGGGKPVNPAPSKLKQQKTEYTEPKQPEQPANQAEVKAEETSATDAEADNPYAESKADPDAA